MNRTPLQPAVPPAPIPCWLHQHPPDWAPGTLNRAALQQAAAALRAEPGFDGHARHFAACWQAAYDGSTTLHAAMRDTPHDLLLVACLRLAHVQGRTPGADDHADGPPGVTRTRLIHCLTRGGRELASVGPSHVKAMLGHARAHGLLRPVAGRGDDARLRPLKPTPLLQQAMSHWVAGFLRGIAPRMALPAAPQVMVARPGFLGELFTYQLAGFVEDRYILSEGLPALRWIMDRTKGYHLFLSLMRTVVCQADRTALALALALPADMAARPMCRAARCRTSCRATRTTAGCRRPRSRSNGG